eukprot:CAMPEP_0197024278 /NCGR_PEP_ID=MMETSP1384-20130603/4860_1 /TAXON_ID=29189 /ORGANISM="Ammonia sp." /LENGTH=242 /DNA_ID=CAMNT_0042452635 /DNA_START=52 /DNA_END=780 /DNA_ORIENTATION=-
MTTFKGLFGPEIGRLVEQYWPYAFLTFSVYLLLYQIGIWKIIYKVCKQAILMSVMLLCCTIWYVLASQYVTALSQIGTTSFLSAFNEVLSGDATKLFSNEQIMDPLSELLLVSGATMFLLGLLYRQLPIDIIPDCIPCIGQYDNMMAGLCSFFGFIVCCIAVYIQYYFLDSPNSTVSLLLKGKFFVQSAGEFVHEKDTKKWDDVFASTQYFVQRGSDILQQSFTFVYNQIQEQMKKHEKGEL